MNSTLDTTLDKMIDSLTSNPDQLARLVLKDNNLLYKMLLRKVCGGEDKVKIRYPELFL